MKRSALFRPLLMAGVLLFAILACMPGPAPATGPTQTPIVIRETVVVAPTEAPAEPPAEPAATEPVVSQQYFTESFDAESSLWSHFVADASVQLTSPGSLATVVQGNVGNMSVGVSDGGLVFDLQSKGLWVYATYDGYEYDDVRLDVVADNRGTNDNNISLICRYSKDEGWYEFNVANSGLYDVLHGKITPDNKVTYGRIADGGSNKIKQGKEINTYSIVCKGRTLILYINGFETRRIDDNQYALKKGKVGISVSSFNNLPVKVSFDSIQISQP